MKVLYLFIVLCSLGIDAQRRHQPSNSDTETSSQNPPPRGRGRARFALTPEYTDLGETQALHNAPPKISTRKIEPRKDVPKVVEKKINRPSKPAVGFYEVSETVDDIPREEPKKAFVGPRVVTESRFENLNLARPLNIAISPPKPQEVTPSELPLPFSQSPPTEVSSKEPQVISSEASNPSSTTPTPAIPKAPHRRFNVRPQTPGTKSQASSSTEKAQLKTTRRNSRVRTQVKTPEQIPASLPNRRLSPRIKKRPEHGPSVFSSETTKDSPIRARTERRATPVIDRRSDEEETFFVNPNPRRRTFQTKQSKQIYRDDSDLTSRSSQARSEEIESASSERPARRRLVSSRKVQSSTTTTTTSSPESEKITLNQRKRSRFTKPDQVSSAPSISRKTRSTTPSRAESTTQAVERSQQRLRVRPKPNAQIHENLPKGTISKQKFAQRIDDFATSSTKEVEIRMPLEEVAKQLSASPRTTIKVSRLQTVSVETKTEKAFRKVYRKRPPVANSSGVTETSSAEKGANGQARTTVTKDGGRQVQVGRKTRYESKKKEKGPEELSSSEEAIGDADNYPAPFIANLQAKKKSKEVHESRSSSSQSSEDSLTKNTKKGAASFAPSTTLESPVPSENSFVENVVIQESGTKSAAYKNKSNRLPLVPKKSSDEGVEGSSSTDRTPLQKYHARFKQNRNQKVEVFTTPKPSKNRTYSPKAPTGIYSSRKFYKSTTIVPEEIDVKTSLPKFSVETSALATQVPPKGFKPKKVNRFSSRYRNDIPRPVGLRVSTSGPTYIPTVPTITPGPVKYEDNLLGLEVISLDEPISNVVQSANLVNENLTSTIIDSTTLATPKENSTSSEKTVSIIERIINSIASISTTTAPDLTTKFTTTTTDEQSTTPSSAILNLVSKKPKDLDQTEIEFKTTEKPTTVIEKILSSLTALRANEEVIDQVGNTLNPSTQSISSTVFLGDLSTSTISSSTDSILSTLLAIDDSSTPFVDSNSVTTRSIPTTLLSTQATSTLDPAFEEITSDQTLPKRTLDQLLSLFNVATTPSTVESTTKVVIVTPKLTTFVTGSTNTPSTVSDQTTTLIPQETTPDITLVNQLSTSTLNVENSTETVTFKVNQEANQLSELSIQQITSNTLSSPFSTEPAIQSSTLTVDPSTQRVDESTQHVTQTTLGVDQSILSVGQSTLGVTQTTLGVDQSTLGVGQSTLGFTQTTLGVDQSTLGVAQSTLGVTQTTLGVDQSTLGVGQSTLGFTRTTLGVDQSTLGVAQSTLGVTQTTLGVDQSTISVGQSTLGVDQSTSSVFKIEQTANPSTASAEQTTPISISTEQSTQTQQANNRFLELSTNPSILNSVEQTTPTSTLSIENTQTTTTQQTSTISEPTIQTTQSFSPRTDQTTQTAQQTEQTTTETTTPSDELNLIVNPLGNSGQNELLSIIDFIAQLRTNIQTTTESTTTDSSWRGQRSTLPTIFTTETSTLPSFSEMTTLFTTTESIDGSSTLTNLEKFEVSRDKVNVFSANEITSEEFSTTTDTINSSTLPTNQDVLSNTVDTNSVTDKPVSNETDVSNLVNSLSAVTNETGNENATLFVSPNITRADTTARSGKLLNFSPNPLENRVDEMVPPRDKDYFIFAILQNNTILRKRPSMYPTKETPFLIYGLLPNNTLVQKFPNGTIVPMERIIRVNGFDTRENPPPVTEKNQENPPDSNESTGNSLEANELSVNNNNNQGNALPKLTEILGKMTVVAFNNIVNQTKNSNQTTTRVETLKVDPKVENRFNPLPGVSNSPTTARVATSSSRPSSSTMKIATRQPTTAATTTQVPTTVITTTSKRASPTTTLLTTTSRRAQTTTIQTTTSRQETTTQTPTTPETFSTTKIASTLPEDSTNEIDPNPLFINVPRTTLRDIVIPATNKPPLNVNLNKLKEKNLTEQQKKDLETIEALEREQKLILEQLSFLTNLNLGQKKSTKDKNTLANKVIAQVVDGAKTTTNSPNSKRTPPIGDLLKDINGNGVGGITVQTPVVSSTYGKTNDALLASLLKEYGVAPTPPKPLADALGKRSKGTTVAPTTTTKRQTTTTTPAPNRFMQGINWLLNTIAPQPTKPPQRKQKPKPIRPKLENEILSKQPTEITPVTVDPPTTPIKLDTKGTGLTDAKLALLIKQLEEVKRHPEKAKELDEETLKTLEKIKGMQKALKSNEIGGIEVYSSSSNGATAKRFVTTPEPKASTEKEKVTLPPVKLNPVPGIPDSNPLIRGQLVDYAINVTKAISSFLGNALQDVSQQFVQALSTSSGNISQVFNSSNGGGAANSFQSMIGSGSRMVRSSISKSNSSNKSG